MVCAIRRDDSESIMAYSASRVERNDRYTEKADTEFVHDQGN